MRIKLKFLFAFIEVVFKHLDSFYASLDVFLCTNKQDNFFKVDRLKK